jgi:hypothetical protein
MRIRSYERNAVTRIEHETWIQMVITSNLNTCWVSFVNCLSFTFIHLLNVVSHVSPSRVTCPHHSGTGNMPHSVQFRNSKFFPKFAATVGLPHLSHNDG